MTQTELARRVGVTPQSWSAWEAGESEPSFTTAKNVAQVLGVNAGWLCFDEGEGPGSVPRFPPPPAGNDDSDLKLHSTREKSRPKKK